MNKILQHIQSEEARINAINRFCKVISLLSAPYVLIYLYLRFYSLSVVMALVCITFYVLTLLNKRGYYHISKVSFIIITNLAVIFYSAKLGFHSGIYLYLMTAPLLVYLLFDYTNFRPIALSLLSYISSFLIIYTLQEVKIIEPLALGKNVLRMLYATNFSTTLIFSFILVRYFAYNHHQYIQYLTEQQKRLVREIEEKNHHQDLLKSSLREREILLSEIHHRVKNNLAVVSGLLDLQASYLTDPKAVEAIEESRNRIKSIALMHEKLYQNKTLGKIDLKECIKELIDNITVSFALNKGNIKIELDLDSVTFGIDESIPVSLIINELITNSFKHAFKGKETGVITIRLKKELSNVVIDYSDNGVGFNFAEKQAQTQFGLTLIDALSYQLEGEGGFKSGNAQGTHFNLSIKI